MVIDISALYRAIDAQIKKLPTVKGEAPAWDIVSWNVGLDGIVPSHTSHDSYVIRCVPLYRCGFEGVGRNVTVTVSGRSYDEIALAVAKGVNDNVI